MTTIPTWDEFMAPSLRVLSDGQTHRAREICKTMIRPGLPVADLYRTYVTSCRESGIEPTLKFLGQLLVFEHGFIDQLGVGGGFLRCQLFQLCGDVIRQHAARSCQSPIRQCSHLNVRMALQSAGKSKLLPLPPAIFESVSLRNGCAKRGPSPATKLSPSPMASGTVSMSENRIAASRS